jgi:hypothetical protein
MRNAAFPALSFLFFAAAIGDATAAPSAQILPPSSPYTATTAGQFATACQSDQGGCADIVGNVLMNKIQYSPTSYICLPDVNYTNKVAPWLMAHPETANMPVSDGIYLALTTIYRCGAPGNN